MDKEEVDWDELKRDLNDPVYVEEFISAAIAMIFEEDEKDEP